MVVLVEYDVPTGYAHEGQIIGLPLQSPYGQFFAGASGERDVYFYCVCVFLIFYISV